VGEIAPGFDANFITLDQDLFTVDTDELDRTRVDATWIRGEQVYQRQGVSGPNT
jgi:predicted amidohydrolase YtcJ